MCKYICICVHIYTYACIPIRLHTYVHICTYTHNTYTHIYMYTYMCMRMYAYIHIYVCVHRCIRYKRRHPYNKTKHAVSGIKRESRKKKRGPLKLATPPVNCYCWGKVLSNTYLRALCKTPLPRKYTMLWHDALLIEKSLYLGIGDINNSCS